MESLTRYREIIARVLEEYREFYARIEDNEVDLTVIQDDLRGEYMLMRIGWQGEDRVDRPILYLRLKNGKIHIEADGTKGGVVTDLTQAGVPNHDIVLAFNPPFVRHLTEYAVS